MTTEQIVMLAADALAYDAVVVLWVSRYGTQPVLMPRSLGQAGRLRRDRDRDRDSLGAPRGKAHSPARRRLTDSTEAPDRLDRSVDACDIVATAGASIGMQARPAACEYAVGASHRTR